MSNKIFEIKPLSRDFIKKINDALQELQEEINAIVASANVDDVVADLTALNNIDTSSLENGYKVQVLSDSDYDDNSTLYKLNKNASPEWKYIGEYGTASYTKEQIQQMLALKQDLITSLNKLSSDLVDDSNSINKFVTQEEKGLIHTNQQNILGIKNGTGINNFRQVEEALSYRQLKITNSNKLSSDLVDDSNSINKFVTQEEKEQISKNAEDIENLKNNPEVRDIVEHKSDLDNYDTSILNVNDIIKVLDDETQDHKQSYYKWTGTQFVLIGSIGPYYTRTEVDGLLNGKQDTLSGSTSIDITSNVVSVKEDYVDSQFLSNTERQDLIDEIMEVFENE